MLSYIKEDAESGLIEIISSICILTLWGQYPKHRRLPVFLHPEFSGCTMGLGAAAGANGLVLLEWWATFFVYWNGKQCSLSTIITDTIEANNLKSRDGRQT